MVFSSLPSEDFMAKRSKPRFYEELLKRNPEVFNALEKLGKTTRAAGPIDARTGHLVHLAAAAAIRSEGAVHSHVRRALEAGVSAKEIRHALIMLLSTIGMPSVVAAMSWAEDVLEEKQARSASK
jgi:4-carboxymuconolactone decarboxylase